MRHTRAAPSFCRGRSPLLPRRFGPPRPSVWSPRRIRGFLQRHRHGRPGRRDLGPVPGDRRDGPRQLCVRAWRSLAPSRTRLSRRPNRSWGRMSGKNPQACHRRSSWRGPWPGSSGGEGWGLRPAHGFRLPVAGRGADDRQLGQFHAPVGNQIRERPPGEVAGHDPLAGVPVRPCQSMSSVVVEMRCPVLCHAQVVRSHCVGDARSADGREPAPAIPPAFGESARGRRTPAGFVIRNR
jgi:hypothetical protein